MDERIRTQQTICLEQYSAHLRDNGEKVEVSKGDLLLLVNFAQVGAHAAACNFGNDGPGKDIVEEEYALRMAIMADAFRARNKQFPSEKEAMCFYVAAALQIIRDRFSDLDLLQVLAEDYKKKHGDPNEA